MGIGSWHQLSLSLNNYKITASLDNKNISTLKDSSYQTGQLGMGITGYDADQFDNVSITPIRTKK